MADDFEEFKKRYQSGKIKEMAIPAPLPGPGGIGRAVAGKVAQEVIKRVGGKKPDKAPSKKADKAPSKSANKAPRSNSAAKGDKQAPRQAGNFAGRRMDDAKKSRGPFGTLATQGTREVTKYSTGPRSVANVSTGSRAVTTSSPRNRLPLPAGSSGSRSVVAGGKTNFGGGGARVVGPSSAATASGASKGFSATPKGDDDRKKNTTRYSDSNISGPQSAAKKDASRVTSKNGTTMATEEFGRTDRYPKSASGKSDRPSGSNSAAKGDLKRSTTTSNAAPKKTFGTQFKSDAAKKFAAKGQGQVSRANPVANQGKKADKPTKKISQGGYKGNWVNAGPAKKPRSLQEAVRGADAGSSFLRGRLTGRNR